MVEPIAEGDKVKAEITHILYKEQVKYIREEGKWYVILQWNLQLKKEFSVAHTKKYMFVRVTSTEERHS